MNLRWLVSAAAWLAFSVAVWFVGDMLTALEGAGARIALIVVVGIAFLAWEIYRARKAAQENADLLAGLIGGSMDADSAERAAAELQTLRKRFEDALGVLKNARFKTPEGEKRTPSRMEAIQAAFDRANKPKGQAEKPPQRAAPAAAEAKAGHNQPPEETPKLNLKKRPDDQQPQPRGDRGQFAPRQLRNPIP